MKSSNRYTCHGCKDEHSTDNVVAYCAPCYLETKNSLLKAIGGHMTARAEKEAVIAALREEIKSLQKQIVKEGLE